MSPARGCPRRLLSSMVLGALSMEFHSGTQPQEVLNRVNRLLCEKSLPYQFVTLFLFLLSPDGTGQFISAGHNPAYLFRSATGKIEKLVSEPLSWGCSISPLINLEPFRLDKGDILVVYSDGLTDAQNPAGRNVRRGKAARNHSARGALGKSRARAEVLESH